MRRTGAAVSLVLALAGGGAACGGDGGGGTPSASSVAPIGIQACEEIYVSGAEITNDNFGVACVDGGTLVSPRPVRLDCTDGRRLFFNDLAWGFFGEGMTLTRPDDPSKMPEAAVDECLAPVGSATAESAAPS
jgi:hypothetical protein